MSDYLFSKVLFFSDEGVGKTTFIKRYCVGSDPSWKRTIGVQIFKLKQDINLSGDNISLCFWNISNHFHQMRILFNGASGGIIMYDITNKNSLSKVLEWSHKVREYCGNIPVLLIGNKLDLEEKREVSKPHGILVKEKNNLTSFSEISVKTGERVENMLVDLINLMMNQPG